MVDALTFFDNFSTSDFLSDREAPGTVDDQDERNVRPLSLRARSKSQPRLTEQRPCADRSRTSWSTSSSSATS